MTLSAAVSLEVVAGNKFEPRFTVTREGEVVDIGQMTPHFALTDIRGTNTFASTEDETAEATITDGEAGEFTTTVAGDITADLLGTYRWQADLEDALGDVETVARGFVTFIQDLI